MPLVIFRYDWDDEGGLSSTQEDEEDGFRECEGVGWAESALQEGVLAEETPLQQGKVQGIGDRDYRNVLMMNTRDIV